MSEERRFHGALSEEYRLVEKAYPHFQDLQNAVGDAMARYARLAAIGTVEALEIGCGDGITSDAILRTLENLNLTALDNEEKMVAQAETNLASWVEAGRLHIECADALAYLEGCAEDSFDVVSSALTLHNFARAYRDPVLAAIYRVLKPGGLFVNADKYAPDGQARFDALGEQLGRFFDTFLPMGKYELLKDWVLHNVADQSPDRVMTESQARTQMVELGFVDVQVSQRHNMEAVLTATKPA